MNSIAVNKVIGYVLLLAGLLLITVPLYQAYNIFTGKALPSQVFKIPNLSPVTMANNNPFDIAQQTQKALMNVLPLDLINNTLNLGSWMILMTLFMFGGGQIANLGIKLLK